MLRATVFLLTCVFLIKKGQTVCKGCDCPNAVYNGKSCLMMIDKVRRSFPDCQAHCSEYGGQLPIVANQCQQYELLYYTQETITNLPTGSGDIANEAIFVWTAASSKNASWTSDGLSSGANLTWAKDFPKIDVADNEHAVLAARLGRYSEKVGDVHLGNVLHSGTEKGVITRYTSAGIADRWQTEHVCGCQATPPGLFVPRSSKRSGCSTAQLSLDTKNTSSSSYILIPSTIPGVSHATFPLASATLEEVSVNTEVMFHCADGHFIESGESQYTIQCEADTNGKTSKWSSINNQCVSDGCSPTPTSCPTGEQLVNVLYFDFHYANVTPVATFAVAADSDTYQDCICTNPLIPSNVKCKSVESNYSEGMCYVYEVLPVPCSPGPVGRINDFITDDSIMVSELTCMKDEVAFDYYYGEDMDEEDDLMSMWLFRKTCSGVATLDGTTETVIDCIKWGAEYNHEHGYENDNPKYCRTIEWHAPTKLCSLKYHCDGHENSVDHIITWINNPGVY